MEDPVIKEYLKRVKHGDLMSMKRLLGMKVPLDLSFIFLNACENNQGEIALLCLEHSPDVVHSVKKEDGCTGLHFAAKSGNIFLLRQLLFNRAYSAIINPNVADILGRYPIFIVAETRHSFVKELLETRNISWEVQDHLGRNIMQIACWNNNIDLFTLLLTTKKHLIDAQDSFGRTVLHTICALGHVEMFRVLKPYLLSHRFQQKDLYGSTPFHIACQHNHLPIIKEMLNMIEVLTTLDTSNKEGLTPLANSVVSRMPSVVELLLASSLPFKFSFDKPIYNCYNILSLASVFPNKNITNLLESNFALLRQKYLSESMYNESIIIYGTTDADVVKAFSQENVRVKTAYFVKDVNHQEISSLKDIFLSKNITVFLLKDSKNLEYLKTHGVNTQTIDDPFAETSLGFAGLAELKLKEEQGEN